MGRVIVGRVIVGRVNGNMWNHPTQKVYPLNRPLLKWLLDYLRGAHPSPVAALTNFRHCVLSAATVSRHLTDLYWYWCYGVWNMIVVLATL